MTNHDESFITKTLLLRFSPFAESRLHEGDYTLTKHRKLNLLACGNEKRLIRRLQKPSFVIPYPFGRQLLEKGLVGSE